MTSLNSIARQHNALPGNMAHHGANPLNDWGKTLSELLTSVYEYLSGGRIAFQKSELHAINKKMVSKLRLFKSQGMPINVPCIMNRTRQIVVLEETKAGVKMSSNGKEVLLKNVEDFEVLYKLLKKEIDEVADQLEFERIQNSPYEIIYFSVA
jgi:hypothetical protein